MEMNMNYFRNKRFSQLATYAQVPRYYVALSHDAFLMTMLPSPTIFSNVF